MGDDLQGAVPALKVVKVLTDDGQETKLQPEFVQVFLKVKQKVDGAGLSQAVSIPLPDASRVGVQKVIESKKQSFDGVEYVANLETMDVHELLKAAFRLGYKSLLDIMAKDYHGRLAKLCQDPNFQSRYDDDNTEQIEPCTCIEVFLPGPRMLAWLLRVVAAMLRRAPPKERTARKQW